MSTEQQVGEMAQVFMLRLLRGGDELNLRSSLLTMLAIILRMFTDRRR
jgi:hypothetical protein